MATCDPVREFCHHAGHQSSKGRTTVASPSNDWPTRPAQSEARTTSPTQLNEKRCDNTRNSNATPALLDNILAIALVGGRYKQHATRFSHCEKSDANFRSRTPFLAISHTPRCSMRCSSKMPCEKTTRRTLLRHAR